MVLSLNISLEGSEHADADELGRAGTEAAQLIWQDDPRVPTLHDPRLRPFADAVIDRLGAELAGAPGILQRVISGAASAAEDLNVEPFQGLVEIIQNADDLHASEVRFALRDDGGRKQLLVVHDGLPVTCQHVLAITLPFLTTKADDADQKGRFGIGLKTLRRISSALAVHSPPYHFAAEHLSLRRVSPELSLPPFYDGADDTLLILDLLPDFDSAAFTTWFDEWTDDGLLFLNSVRRFRWCDLAGDTISEKFLTATDWRDCTFEQLHDSVVRIRTRELYGGSSSWTTFSADVRVPAALHRAHKAKGELTSISVAVSSGSSPNGLFIGFRTRVPVSLSVSIDAQFDPSTAREELIENAWNSWLIERCADLLIDVASGLFIKEPQSAWCLIPLSQERIGPTTIRWPGNAFAAAFLRVRNELGIRGALSIGGVQRPLSEIAYEQEVLSGLVGPSELELLFPECAALPDEVRDSAGRWRRVLSQLEVSRRGDTAALLDGFSRAIFNGKTALWCVEAGDRIAQHHPNANDILNVPCWLTADGRQVSARPKGTTASPLVLSQMLSGFCNKWGLIDCLHDSYGDAGLGERAVAWLIGNAAFSAAPDAETELAAFAERFQTTPVEIQDADLRELRDRFDTLTDRRAEALGGRVGSALLLDGFFYKRGKRVEKKVSPVRSYLSRTLDSDHPHWPDAAEGLPDIEWLSAGYQERLRTGATRTSRKRADGTISRGPRKFLMLLGAECAPRLTKMPRRSWGTALRNKELRRAGAEFVKHDYEAPDQLRVIDALPRRPKKERRVRSAGLLRALSRNWDRLYARNISVPSVHQARVYTYDRAAVSAAWLNMLRESAWVAVGNGELAVPESAVIKTPETAALYDSKTFASNIEEAEIHEGMASALRLITDVRVRDVVGHLEAVREGSKPFDHHQVMAIYRTLAKRCPDSRWGSRAGDMSLLELRQRFSEGTGLICLSPGVWSRPGSVCSGKDIFHQPRRFVPGGVAYQALWDALQIGPPKLDDCIDYCRDIAKGDYTPSVEAALIDVYRFMERLTGTAERRERDRLRKLPLNCFGLWRTQRPALFVEDRELRVELALARGDLCFWTPPCDTRDLASLKNALGLSSVEPELSVQGNQRRALEAGDDIRARFQRGVDHLSNELARNDPLVREGISTTWDLLRDIPLFLYDEPFFVTAQDALLGGVPVKVTMKALLLPRPFQLHLWRDGLLLREHCGRAVASLFPPESRRRIEAEWVTSWIASQDKPVERMRFASDEDHAQAVADLAKKAEAAAPLRIKVTPVSGKTNPLPARTLKETQEGVKSVSVLAGSSSGAAAAAQSRPLSNTPPASSAPQAATPSAPLAYTSVDLEQRAWEVLKQVLDATETVELTDFRRRHGVGADGAIDWKTFVELKATGRAPQSSIELSNAEFERAKERGLDFILALVSGLENGERTEVRFILDPANRATIRPVHGVRIVGLSDLPAVVVEFEGEDAPR